MKKKSNTNITILGVPTHWGTGLKNLIKGPSAFRNHGIIEKLSTAGFDVQDAGDIDCNSDKKPTLTNVHLRNIDEVVAVSKLTSKKVYSIIKAGRVPIVIGGDHSMSIGTISGAAKAFDGNIGIIYIDEHGDLNTDRTTDTGNIHGMSLCAVMGLGNKRIAAISGTAVKKENVLHIGGEMFDTAELELIRAQKIETVKLTDIINSGLKPVTEAVDRLSKKVDNIWVSFDIDSMDANDAPGVTMPDRYGLIYREISDLARHIGTHVNVVGVGVAEYNPVNEKTNKTLELITELVASFLGGDYSWYDHKWMSSHKNKIIRQNLLIKDGLFDSYIKKVKKTNIYPSELKKWSLKVKKFLQTVTSGKMTEKKVLSPNDFARLVGFAEVSEPTAKQKKRRDVFWRSSEEIKKEKSLGIFQIDVTRLPENHLRQLLDYFVKIIYQPRNSASEQQEFILFLSQIQGNQYKEEEDIKIGILHSLSGTMAMSETSLVDAALMAIDEINEQGGVLGRRIKPIIVDGASDPDRFATEVLELIDNQGVKSVFGGWTSASRKMMKPIFEKYNNLLWYSVQYEGLEESSNIIYLGATPNQQMLPAVDWAYKHLGKRFFLVGSDYVYPRSANKIIKQKIKALGGSVVGEEYQILGSTDFSKIVKKISKTKPDVILNTINGDSNVSFFELLRLEGIQSKKIPSISFSISEEEISDMDVKTVVGDYAVWNYFQSINSKPNKEFVARFKKKYGKDRVTNDPIEATYTAIHLFAKAVALAGSDEPNNIRKVLERVSFDAPEGKVKVDPKTQHISRTVRIGKIDIDGQFKIVWDSKKPISAKSYPGNTSVKEWNTFLNDLYVGWDKKWTNS